MSLIIIKLEINIDREQKNMAELSVDKRQVFLADRLNNGARLTVKGVKKLIKDEFKVSISTRTAERDLVKLLENFPDAVSVIGDRGVKTVYAETPMSPDQQGTLVSHNLSKHLLSLNMLKAHLTAFKDSVIDEQVDELIGEIEKHVGEDELISPESLYWDQNYGKYQYQKADSNYIDIINKLTESLHKKKWIKIAYKNMSGKRKRFIVKPYQFFYFSGTLYIAVYYAHGKYVMSLAVHHLESVSSVIGEELKKHQKIKVPEFDYKDFRSKRFGVFSGDPVKVLLEVDQDYRQYFINRKFHDSQTTFNESDASEPIIIRMNVPLAPELIAWILKWNGGLKVKQPQELKDKVKEAAQKIVEEHG